MNKSNNPIVVPLTDNKSYSRDMTTGAIVLNDSAELAKYQSARDKKIAEIKKMAALQSEVNSLKTDVETLMDIVKQLQEDRNRE